MQIRQVFGIQHQVYFLVVIFSLFLAYGNGIEVFGLYLYLQPLRFQLYILKVLLFMMPVIKQLIQFLGSIKQWAMAQLFYQGLASQFLREFIYNIIFMLITPKMIQIILSVLLVQFGLLPQDFFIMRFFSFKENSGADMNYCNGELKDRYS